MFRIRHSAWTGVVTSSFCYELNWNNSLHTGGHLRFVTASQGSFCKDPQTASNINGRLQKQALFCSCPLLSPTVFFKMSSDDKDVCMGVSTQIVDDISSPGKVDVAELRNDDDESSYSAILDAENRKAAERKLVRKLDSRLLPTIVLIYIMNYIDVRGCLRILQLGICF